MLLNEQVFYHGWGYRKHKFPSLKYYYKWNEIKPID